MGEFRTGMSRIGLGRMESEISKFVKNSVGTGASAVPRGLELLSLKMCANGSSD